MENSKVFTAFFTSVFSGKICFHIREEEVLERERERLTVIGGQSG